MEKMARLRDVNSFEFALQCHSLNKDGKLCERKVVSPPYLHSKCRPLMGLSGQWLG